MKKLMCCDMFLILLLGLLAIVPVMSSWEFAVATSSKLLFYNSNWELLTEAGHQYTNIAAFAYDEVQDVLYFHDQDQTDYAIFSLQLAAGNNHNISKVLPGTRNINGLAFDPVDRKLYWTEDKSVYKMPVDTESNKVELVKVFNGSEHLDGIALDACKRRIYFSDKYTGTSAIHMTDLSGKEDEPTKITEDIYIPRGIFIDQESGSLSWVEKKSGGLYAIEKADQFGGNRVRIVAGYGKDPKDLVVDSKNIYWTDLESRSVYKSSKETPNANPIKLHTFSSSPTAIVMKNQLRNYNGNSTACLKVYNEMRNQVIKEVKRPEWEESALACMNKGIFNVYTRNCICPKEFEGRFCEKLRCQNYCINGECEINEEEKIPVCKCNPGFKGKRCEVDLCDSFCLHKGECVKDADQLPMCSCKGTFIGERCEIDSCEAFCLNGGFCEMNEFRMPTCRCDGTFRGERCESNLCVGYCLHGFCHILDNGTATCQDCEEGFTGERCETNICDDYCVNDGKCGIVKGARVCQCGEMYSGDRCEVPNLELVCKIYFNKTEINDSTARNLTHICSSMNVMQPDAHRMPCHNSFNKTLVYTSLSFTVSLALLCIIIAMVRRIQKPLRPRITKKMVVKNFQTPLTSRPHTQCEITIEDCCNMNICETPCFDTKYLHSSSTKKEKTDTLNLLDDVESIAGSYKELPSK